MVSRLNRLAGECSIRSFDDSLARSWCESRTVWILCDLEGAVTEYKSPVYAIVYAWRRVSGPVRRTFKVVAQAQILPPIEAVHSAGFAISRTMVVSALKRPYHALVKARV